MALKCDHCHRKSLIGSKVSHAKNRLRRVFKPNLQKLKAFDKGHLVSVKLCTRCIKRLKKDNILGTYAFKMELAKRPVVALEKKEAKPLKIEKAAKSEEKFSIDSIVGKKS